MYSEIFWDFLRFFFGPRLQKCIPKKGLEIFWDFLRFFEIFWDFLFLNGVSYFSNSKPFWHEIFWDVQCGWGSDQEGFGSDQEGSDQEGFDPGSLDFWNVQGFSDQKVFWNHYWSNKFSGQLRTRVCFWVSFVDKYVCVINASGPHIFFTLQNDFHS